MKKIIFLICTAMLFALGHLHARTVLTDVQCDSDSVASLDRCTTIDAQITSKCKKQLAVGLKRFHGSYGQLAVLDAQTGQLKAWVALAMKDGKVVDALLQKQSCTTFPLVRVASLLELLASVGKGVLSDSIDVDNGFYPVNDTLIIRDHNWRIGGYGRMSVLEAFTKHSNVASFKLLERHLGRDEALKTWQGFANDRKVFNAMEQAVVFNSFCSVKPFRSPSLIGDSLVTYSSFPTDVCEICRDVLTKMNEGDGLQAKYAPRGVKLAGCYSYVTIAKAEAREFSFYGAFPADNPRYAIGVFIDTDHHGPLSNAELARSVVNPIVVYLVKR